MGAPEYLIFMPHNPGDVVMALQAVSTLHAAVPNAEIDFLTGEECGDLVAGCRDIRHVLTVPRKSLVTQFENRGLDSALEALTQFLGSLENREYDGSLNLFQGRFGGILQGFVRAKKKLGLELREGSRFEIGSRVLEHLFAIPARRGENPFHAADLYRLAACELAGIPPSLNPMPALRWKLPPNPLPLPPQSYFVFHPGSAHRGKRWPLDRWRELIRLCMAEGRTVVLTGSPEEKKTSAGLLEGLGTPPIRGVVDLTGKTSWVESAAVFRDALRVVSGDTVAMHLGATVGTKVIALFGPSNPVETGPYGSGHCVLQNTPMRDSELRLDEPSPELACITASEVLSLLQGKFPDPGSNNLWFTEWDENGLYALKNPTGDLHPFQGGRKGWLDILQGRIRGDNGDSPPLLRTLDMAIASPGAQTVRDLEAAEKVWAEKTREDLVWEAYRIALNGMAIRPLEQYLRLRRKRLVTALDESYLAR